MVQAPETARPKVMTVYGTRPEAIKVAPVITRLNDDPRKDFWKGSALIFGANS